jgi:uncharacterized protein (DUF1015 family)
MRVLPFQGRSYSDRTARREDLIAPPYDQIDEALRQRLQENPSHFSHLTLPDGLPSPLAYEGAVALQQNWLDTGLITQQEQPCLYPYEIISADEDRRLGLAAMVGLEDLESGSILGHEQTVTETVTERLNHLRGVQTDLEPIFLLCRDQGHLDQMLAEEIEQRDPCMQHRDLTGHQHILYKIEDKTRIAKLQEILAPLGAMIADGHHRYEVASRYANEIGARAGTGPAAKLSVISSLTSAGVTIDPIHRGFGPKVGFDQMRDLCKSCVPWTGTDGSDFAAAVNTAHQPAIGVWNGVDEPAICTLSLAGASTTVPEAVLASSVYLLHRVLYPQMGLAARATTDGTTLYRSNPQTLWDEVERRDLAVGVWLPSMSPAAFASAVDARVTLPPKSTRFLPKLASGLVWASHDALLG